MSQNEHEYGIDGAEIPRKEKENEELWYQSAIAPKEELPQDNAAAEDQPEEEHKSQSYAEMIQSTMDSYRKSVIAKNATDLKSVAVEQKEELPQDNAAIEDQPEEEYEEDYNDIYGGDIPPPKVKVKPNNLYGFDSITSKKFTDGLTIDFNLAPKRWGLKKSSQEKVMKEMSSEDINDVKSGLTIVQSPESTLVTIIAVSKNDKNNQLNHIKCAGGEPLRGYAYDSPRDAYIVKCAESLLIGQVPCAFVVLISKTGNWQSRIPVPENTLLKHMTPNQRDAVNSFKEKYSNKNEFDIHFVQAIGSF